MSHFFKDHFSNINFLEVRVRVRVIGSQGYNKREVRVLGQELGLGEMALEKRSGVQPIATQYNIVQHCVK